VACIHLLVHVLGMMRLNILIDLEETPGGLGVGDSTT